MKQIINKFGYSLFGIGILLCLLERPRRAECEMLGVDFYLFIVMEGINLTVVGTDVKSVKSKSLVTSISKWIFQP